MSLTSNVGGMVVCFPCRPCFCYTGFGLPFVGRARKVIRGEDCSGGNGEELVVRHGKIGAGELALGFLEHVDVLGDSLSVGVVSEHFGGEVDKLARVEASTVCVEVFEQLLGGDVGVE